MAAVEVQVLGPLRVRVDGVDQRLGGRRERVVLALLAAAAGAEVSPDRLVDEVWREQAPPSATGSLQVAISRLRSLLEPDRRSGEAPSVLVRGRAGYALVGADLDARAFSAAARDAAAGDPGQVERLTEAALTLWRGRPYADLPDVAVLDTEVTRLEDDRLRLVEARGQALLDLGRQDEAQAMLAPLAGENPFRERLWSLLAVALYRCDRQADALEALRTLRTHLVEELGVDPSPSVRRLEEDLLAQAPHLDVRPHEALPTMGAETRARESAVVGRSGALATLDAAVESLVVDSRGGLLLLTGEAGIGKTRLAGELADRAARRGAAVSVGRCHEADLAPAYWPWLPVLRDLVGDRDDVPPEVDVLLGSTPSRLPETVDAGAATLRTFDAVTRVVAAADGPLVVVLEDMHWSDSTSLRLLAYAAEALGDRPVLLVVTVRDVDPRSHPALTRALAALARIGATRLRVGALGPEAVAELLADVLDEPDPALADVLTRRTDGNPFYVLEMARLLADTGRATAEQAADLEVPDGIADVVRLRVLRLGDEAREALAVASVVGRQFDATVVDSAAGRPVLDALDEALGAGVIESGAEEGRYRFVHALSRETVYGDLRPGQRARWHARVGAALADRLGADPELVAEVAHHFSRAAAYLPEVVSAAVEHGRAAALAAERGGAFEEALALWNRTTEIERRDAGPDRLRRHDLLLRLATARQRMGDMVGAQAALDEAVALARPFDDHVRMAEAVTSFRSFGVWHWREMGSADEETVAVLLECLDHVEDLGLQARLWANLGMEYYVMWRTEDSDRCGDRSLELAREHGDKQVLLDCLASRVVAWFPGRSHEREAWARESLRLGLTGEQEIAARFHLAVALYHQGRTSAADDAMAGAHTIAAELRYTGCDIPLAWWRWLRAVDVDDPGADEVARAALARHRRSTMVGLDELTGLAAVGGVGTGEPVPADVVAIADGHPNRSFRAVIAHALTRSGETSQALRILGELPPEGEHDYASHFADCLRVVVLAAAGDDRLSTVVERILPFAEDHATYGSVVSGGSTAYFAAVGLEALGRAAEARELLAVAVESNRTAGLVRWHAAARDRLASLR